MPPAMKLAINKDKKMAIKLASKPRLGGKI